MLWHIQAEPQVVRCEKACQFEKNITKRDYYRREVYPGSFYSLPVKNSNPLPLVEQNLPFNSLFQARLFNKSRHTPFLKKLGRKSVFV